MKRRVDKCYSFIIFFLFSFFFLWPSLNCEGKTRCVIRSKSQLIEALTKSNSTLIIKRNIDLGGNIIFLADGSELKFSKRGVIRNGHIVFNGTVISGQRKGRFQSCSFSGKLASKQCLFLSTFGPKANGQYDDASLINQLFDCIDGQFCELVFDSDTDYGISKKDGKNNNEWTSISVCSNVIVSFIGKGRLVALGHGRGGGLFNISNVNNVVINNIKLYGGGEDGVVTHNGLDGIGLYHCNNIHINGGTISGFYRGSDITEGGKFYEGDGGAGIQLEISDISDCFVRDISFNDCYFAIRSSRDMKEKGPIEAHFNNITAENCNCFVNISIANRDKDINIENIITIDGFTVRDCGEEHGVFLFNRARNIVVKNGDVTGLTNTPAVFRGRFALSSIKNVRIKQPCLSVFDFSPIKFSFGSDETQPDSLMLDIDVKGDYVNILKTDKSGKYSLINSYVKIKTNKLFENKPIVSGSVLSSGKDTLDLTFPGNRRFIGSSDSFILDYGATPSNIHPVSNIIDSTHKIE